MIKSLVYTCDNNSIDLINDECIRFVDLQGVSPASSINTSSIAGYDGASYISEQMPMRNITIMLQFKKNAEATKTRLYNAFITKKEGTLTYTSSTQSVKISCRVERIDIPPNVYPLKCQISLLCPQPYFESLTQLQAKIASVMPLVAFPFTISAEGIYLSQKSESVMVEVENPSSVDVGMKVVFYANSEVVNPSLLNVDTGELLKLNYTMLAGDTITVNTYRGQKAITLTRNGVGTNIFNYKASNFKFLQLYQGTNLFRYNADSNLNGLEVTIYYKELYGGV